MEYEVSRFWMTKLDASLMTSLPASDPGSAAVWGSKRINPRPQSCLCLTWSGYPSNDDDDERNAPISQVKIVNAPSTSTLNASTDEFQPPTSNVRTVSRSENNLKYSPSVIIEILDNNEKWRKAVALLDSGSDVTLIKRDTVQKLLLTSNRKPFVFKFGTAGGDSYSENPSTLSL